MNMEPPVFHSLVQGSPEWHEFRATQYNASDAPAVLGVSLYTDRAALVRAHALGSSEEIDPETQRRFDQGHAAEAAARPIIEERMNESLFPGVVSRVVEGLPLSASCDGLTLSADWCFEHKLWNESLAAEVVSGRVPDSHAPQLEQQLLVTGARRCLFVVSDGTREKMVNCWYESAPDLRARLVAAWAQFREDVANYEHKEVPPPAAAPVLAALPVLTLDIIGSVRDTNLGAYQSAITARIEAINTALETDEDFAEAEANVKLLKEGEGEVKAAKARALEQAADINALFDAADALSALMRKKRLELEKLVASRKDAIRAEIVAEAVDELRLHATKLAEGCDTRIGAPGVPAEFRSTVAAAMKGKRTVATLRDAAHQAVTDAKLALNEVVSLRAANLRAYDELNISREAHYLFPDLDRLVDKPLDDFIATIKSRIADEIERQRQREAEERARAERLRQNAPEAPPATPPAAQPEPAVSSPPSEPEPAAATLTFVPDNASALADGPVVVLMLSGESTGDIHIRLPVDVAADLRNDITKTLRYARKAA